jgi:L-alanine-DL-glutamate epimerase-like enolase superfamily enzyme
MIGLEVAIERWELIEPFATARDCVSHVPVLVVVGRRNGQRGWAEAAGVDYDGESPESMAAQVESIRDELRDDLAWGRSCGCCPPAARVTRSTAAVGPARQGNGRAGVDTRRSRRTTTGDDRLDLGLGDDATTRRKAREARGYPLLKLKVDAHRPLEIVRSVREASEGTTGRRCQPVLDPRTAGRPVARAASNWASNSWSSRCRDDDAALDGLTPSLPLARG